MFDQGEKINSKYRREQYSTLEHGENNLRNSAPLDFNSKGFIS